jgi:hypothetical protein
MITHIGKIASSSPTRDSKHLRILNWSYAASLILGLRKMTLLDVPCNISLKITTSTKKTA